MPVYAMVYVHAGAPWPAEEFDVPFGAASIHLVPPRSDQNSRATTYPIASFVADTRPEATAGLPLVRRFLSALAWREQTYIREVEVTVGPPLHFSTALPDNTTTSHFRPDLLVDPPDREARLALAFYRDGLSVQHTAFRFLSLFKILNIRLGTGREQAKWINDHLSSVVGQTARERIANLQQSVADVGQYLYESGRCAVAHAFSTPLVDPDDPEDDRRLNADMGVIRELGAHFIIAELGLPTPLRSTAA